MQVSNNTNALIQVQGSQDSAARAYPAREALIQLRLSGAAWEHIGYTRPLPKLWVRHAAVAGISGPSSIEMEPAQVI